MVVGGVDGVGDGVDDEKGGRDAVRVPELTPCKDLQNRGAGAVLAAER